MPYTNKLSCSLQVYSAALIFRASYLVMGKSSLLKGIRVVMLSLIIALLINGEILEARFSPAGFSTMPEEKIDRRIVLRELQENIFDYYQRRLMMLGASTQRVSPGGPDSQHH